MFDPVETEVFNSGKKFKQNNFSDDEEKGKHMALMKAGRQLCRMRQSCVDNNILATGGKENDLQIWDVNKLQNPVTSFVAKNVKPDKLQVPANLLTTHSNNSDLPIRQHQIIFLLFL